MHTHTHTMISMLVITALTQYFTKNDSGQEIRIPLQCDK